MIRRSLTTLAHTSGSCGILNYAAAILAACLGIALTTGVFLCDIRNDAVRFDLEMRASAESRAKTVDSELDRYIDAVEALQAHVRAQVGQVSESGFRTVAHDL